MGKGSTRVYRSGLHPDLKLIIRAVFEICPIDLTLVSGVRGDAEQFKLFQIGRRYNHTLGKWEKTGATVTNCDGYDVKSNHQKRNGYGMAVDVSAYVPGNPQLNYDRLHLAAVIGCFLTISEILYREGKIDHILKAGADWDGDTHWLEPGTFHDLPHLELIEP
jgi:hypothetical protein